MDTVPDILTRCFSVGPSSYLFTLRGYTPLKIAVASKTGVICRILAHPRVLELMRLVEILLAIPSASTSGRTSLGRAEMVELDLGDKIDGILDGGECQIDPESTITAYRIELRF